MSFPFLPFLRVVLVMFAYNIVATYVILPACLVFVQNHPVNICIKIVFRLISAKRCVTNWISLTIYQHSLKRVSTHELLSFDDHCQGKAQKCP
jgi:hypothetical protein